MYTLQYGVLMVFLGLCLAISDYFFPLANGRRSNELEEAVLCTERWQTPLLLLTRRN